MILPLKKLDYFFQWIHRLIITELEKNKVILYVPLHNKENGLFCGITKKLAQITLRGDINERFYSYGYSKEKKQCIVLC